jgi:hypothetical protein
MASGGAGTRQDKSQSGLRGGARAGCRTPDAARAVSMMRVASNVLQDSELGMCADKRVSRQAGAGKGVDQVDDGASESPRAERG